MVSRGGRSRGCANCRRRRVKCDETRPTCNRCQKLGLGCAGPKEQTWINQYTASASPSLSNSQKTPLVPSSPTNLSLVAFKDDIYLAYARKILLRGGPIEVAMKIINNDGSSLTENPGPSLLRDAILSLAATFFGSQHHQTTITRQGYQQYGTVLRRLNTHLMRPTLQTTDETILTALTCMLLEIFLPTGPNHFLKHMQGIEAILEIRGPPSTPMSETTQILFTGLRILSIVGGLVMSRPSLYSRPEWKAIHIVHRDKAAELRYRIFTVLADCTRLMHLRDIVLYTEDAEAKKRLINEIHLLFKELETIHQESLSFGNTQRKGLSSSIEEEPSLTNYTFATIYLLYNATYICILDTLDALEPLPHFGALRRNAALEIIKGLELKGYEQRLGAPESNTIGFVATKISWEALGGFNTPEGRKLAVLVKKAVNNTFASGAWGNESLAPLDLGSQVMAWRTLHHEQRFKAWANDVTGKDEDKHWLFAPRALFHIPKDVPVPTK